MKTFDVLAVGNAMLDAFLTIQENNVFTRVNTEDKELCFKYGEKIHVEKAELLVGGNASNIAVGLHRQGFTTGLFAEIGDDEFSQKILHTLQKEHLDTSFLVQTPGMPASFSIGINIAGERTLFVDHVKRQHLFNFADVAAKWMYVTSLGVSWREAYSRAIAFAVQQGCQLAFSPGTHQFEELSGINEALSASEILFVNKDEAWRLLGQGERKDIKELLISLQKMGPKVVSITDGTNGSYTIDALQKMYQIGLFPSTVIEKTGAGDAYASGFLGAIIAGQNISDAMRWGAINASSVVSVVGAQTGLLKREDLEKKATEFPEFTANEI